MVYDKVVPMLLFRQEDLKYFRSVLRFNTDGTVVPGVYARNSGQAVTEANDAPRLLPDLNSFLQTFTHGSGVRVFMVFDSFSDSGR
jgi:hypothetical protein